MNIVLFGYRGCGKSTIGRLVAESLEMTFVDTDPLICEHFAGLTIREIWQQHGEPAFRNAECLITTQCLAADNQVIALGGGTVIQPDARKALAQADHAVKCFIDCPLQELARRVHGDAKTHDQRPNLTGLGGGIDEIRTVLQQRLPIYRACADHVITVTEAPPAENAQRIIDLIQNPTNFTGN